MSYDPKNPFNDGQGQNNPGPEDEHRTVPMQQNFDVTQAGFPPSDYDAPTVVYEQPTASTAPSADFAQAPVQPGMPFHGTLPPATTRSPKKRPSNKTLLIGGGSVLVLFILIIGVFMVLPNLTESASNQASVTTPMAVASPTTSPATKNIYTPYLAQYRGTIRSQIARGLHLPVDQLVSRLKEGTALSSIASAQGISRSQLQTIVKTAFQQGFQPAVNNGNLTPKQVDALINRMLKQPQTLERYLNVAARNDAKSKATPTPTV